MTTALLPISPALLRSAIAAAWPGCRDAAGADPRSRLWAAASTTREGHWLSVTGFNPDADASTYEHAWRAAENVARSLEDLGYHVVREEGSPPRVVGVVADAAREPWEREARAAALHRERAERDEAVAPGVDVKRVGAEQRDAAAYGRTGT